MKKVLTVIGTRPEAIKICSVIRALEKKEGIVSALAVTGQHRELLLPVMRELGLSADHVIEVMREGQSLSSLGAALLSGCERIIKECRPDLVLVHGDTSSAYFAALSAFYSGLAVAHVEAGLRTESVRSPFPEEYNRRSISLISDVDFAPTPEAAKRLISEGKREDRVFVTGNTVIDSFRYTLRERYDHDVLRKSRGKRLILLTSHRRENIGEPMRGVFAAIRDVCQKREDILVLYPMHMNREVRKIAERELSGCRGVILSEPLGVCDMHNIMARSYMVLTDSGGIQEEATHLGIPTLVLRDSTERREGVDCGAMRLVGTEYESVASSIRLLLDDASVHLSMKNADSPYGDGRAGERIASVIETFLEGVE